MTALVLADKSAWEQQRHSAHARETFTRLAHDNRLAVCDVVALELLYSTRDPAEYEARRQGLKTLVWLEQGSEAGRLARDIQARLARKGQHRRAIPDLLIAATAVLSAATVLHYDRDFDLIAEVVDVRTEWVVPRGAGHGGATG
ncbi:PIN domain-containing protein [Schumannella luteola]